MFSFIPTKSGKAAVNGIEIYYETFGNAANPAVLLIMGLDAQCILFGENFIRPLVEAGYYVVRFDNRDIGLSTWLNDRWKKSKPYTLEDMATDTLGLMKHLSIKKAHLIGVSMGGMIAQTIAIQSPKSVYSLTSIMSSGFVLDPNLQKKVILKYLSLFIPFFLKRFYIKNKITDHKITVDNYLATYKMLKGKRFPFDKEYLTKIFKEGIEERKGQNPRAKYQQFCAIVASGSRLKKLHLIKAPTLVIHGTTDPLIDVSHAHVYAPLIKNAKLYLVEGMGHELPKGALEEIMPQIIQHLNQ